MPTDSLSRLAYRKDQILQLAFPKPPSLAGQISNGVLKREGAIQYDEAVQGDREKIQNILKLALQWPKFTDLHRQFTILSETVSGLAAQGVSTTALDAAIAALSATVSAHTLTINNLNSSILNLTAALNENATPLLVFTNSGETPLFPAITGKMGIFGAQRATNTFDGNWWTWNGNGWSTG